MTAPLLRTELPRVYFCPSTRSRWRVRDDTAESDVTAAARIVQERPETLEQGHYFKHEKRRLIFRFQSGAATLAVKAMPLASLRARLAYKQYAHAEAVHLLRAKQLGLPVPAVLAYGEHRRRMLVHWNAVVMEFLPHVPLRERLLANPPDDEKWSLLRRAMALLKKLYLTGCNHIDFGPHAVMLDPLDGQDDRLIDFQYCHFYPQPQTRTLAAQAGYFAWSVSTNRDWVSAEAMLQWFEELLALCDLLPEKDQLLSVFHRARARRAPIKERLAQ